MRIKIVALVLIALCLILTVLTGIIDLRLGLALAAIFGFYILMILVFLFIIGPFFCNPDNIEKKPQYIIKILREIRNHSYKKIKIK